MFLHPAASDELVLEEVPFDTTDPDRDLLRCVVRVVTDILAISMLGFIVVSRTWFVKAGHQITLE